MTANLRNSPGLSDDYWEQLWRAVPDDAVPPDLRLRTSFALERLPGVPARVLDVGCGAGEITAELACAGLDVVAVDVAEEALRRARARVPGLDARRVGVDGCWPLDDASFDAVWAGETIEHVADTAAWLSEVRRVLRSGGSLLLSTPAHGRLRMLALALSARRLDEHFDPRSDHLRFYTRRTLARLLADFGFERIDVAAAGGPPGARHALLASARRARF